MSHIRHLWGGVPMTAAAISAAFVATDETRPAIAALLTLGALTLLVGRRLALLGFLAIALTLLLAEPRNRHALSGHDRTPPVHHRPATTS